MSHQISADTPYCYLFVRKDLSTPQIVVQASHAAIMAGQQLISSAIEHPHLVVCGMKSEMELIKLQGRLKEANIRFCAFEEPDRDNETTAVITEPVFGEQRRMFRRFNCFGSQERENHECS